MTTPSRATFVPSRIANVSWNMTGMFMLAVSAIGVSPQSLQLQGELSRLAAYYAFPASGVRDRRRERFARLSQHWRRDTEWLSSTTEIAMHPAYQEIVGMGPDALPFILEELRNDSDYWFWALKAISGHDPVPPKHRGTIHKMRTAWLEWGLAKGLITE